MISLTVRQHLPGRVPPRPWAWATTARRPYWGAGPQSQHRSRRI